MKVDPIKDISAILKRLSTMYSQEGERISWPSGDLGECTFALLASLRFTPKIEDHLKDAALWDAVNACARAKHFSQRFFLSAVRNTLSKIQSTNPTQFAVVAQLNVPNHKELPRSLSSMYGLVHLSHAMERSDLRMLNQHDQYQRPQLDFQDDFVFMRHRFKSVNNRSAIDYG